VTKPDTPAGTKQCLHCKAIKALDDFYTDRKARDGRRPECKSCNLARRAAHYRENPGPAIERAKRWREANPERYEARMQAYADSGKKISDRKSHLKRKYGLTLEDFDRMLAAQHGGCAICGELGVDHIDHDHANGAVRGVLCFRCNAAIGQLDDDPERARALAHYLERDDELDGLTRTRARALTLV